MSTPNQTQLETAVVHLRAEEGGLLAKIADRSAVVGILGLGYVGLPLALEAAHSGFPVIGLDVDNAKIERIKSGKSYLRDISDAQIAEVHGRLEASSDLALLRKCDVIVVAVPTPLTKNLTPDLSYIEGAGNTIADHLRAGQLVTLESTTYPGTTEEVLQPILEKGGLRADRDFYLAHSPERVDPGRTDFQTKNTPKVVGAIGANSQAAAEAFYGAFIDTIVPVKNVKTAELAKVYENIYRAVNVGLVNELALLCDRMHLDVWEVLDAAFTKPFGIQKFYPGPGVGGHCIPLDPHYLEHKAKEFQFTTRFIAVAGEINRKMPRFVVEKAARLLNEFRKPLAGSKIVILGVAYKPNIEDYRESPVLEAIHHLKEASALVSYCDPHVPAIHADELDMVGAELTEELIRNADLVIIATPHKAFPLELIANWAPAILDTRNALRDISVPNAKIMRL